MNDIEQQILDLINYDYSNITLDTCLYELFNRQDEAIKAYIKVGRKFWHYDEERAKWRKLTVTYIRTGVMFFTFDDESDVEWAWFMGSINALSLHATEIYPYEISEILREWYPDNDLAEICKTCKWDDCDRKIAYDTL